MDVKRRKLENTKEFTWQINIEGNTEETLSKIATGKH